MLSIRRKISVNRGKKNTGNKRQPGQSVFRIRFKKVANTRGAKLDFFSFSILNFPSSKIEWLIRINFDSIVFKWCWIFVLILRRSLRYIRSALIYHVLRDTMESGDDIRTQNERTRCRVIFRFNKNEKILLVLFVQISTRYPYFYTGRTYNNFRSLRSEYRISSRDLIKYTV